MVLARVRPAVFARDRACRVCGRLGQPDDHLHELWPRSLSRGLPPTLRFSLVNCIRVCPRCHPAITEHRIWPWVWGDGANGILTWARERPPLEYRPRDLRKDYRLL